MFNQSRQTFAWGSNDVVPIFTHGGKGYHIWINVYEESMIDFADKDGARLDEWVYSEVEQFFKKAIGNASLEKQLYGDQIIFFLHLLGKVYSAVSDYQWLFQDMWKISKP